MYSVNGVFMNNNLYEDEYRVGGEYGIKLDALSSCSPAPATASSRRSRKRTTVSSARPSVSVSCMTSAVARSSQSISPTGRSSCSMTTSPWR